MATKKDAGREMTTTSSKQEIDVSQGEPTFEGRYYNFPSDIIEDDTTVTVVADLPGVSSQTLEIDLRDNTLTILGRVEPVPGSWRPMHSEYEIGGYLRRFNLGPAIDQEKIKATMHDGVLHLVLAKADRLRPRKIEVRTN